MAAPSEVRRLASDDVMIAKHTLRLMAEVFDEESSELTDAYVASLLARSGFWLLTALRDGAPVGGLTAHALPMTRNESTELFIYDLAVHPHVQRQGIGRALVTALRTQAAAAGITVSFVPADDEDEHALAFYRALGGAASPVTIFTFDDSESTTTLAKSDQT